MNITIYSGKSISIERPDIQRSDIAAIAHSLSMLCRFNGHVTSFYSVAQHCVYVSNVVPTRFAMDALLHDASEAIVGDVTRPLKQMLGAAYTDIEQKVQEEVCRAFGLHWPIPSAVHMADAECCRSEANALLPGGPHGWADGADDIITPWSPDLAKHRFLERYHELTASYERGLAGAGCCE